MSPADLPLSLEAGSVIRELGAGEALFEQGDRAAAIYKVESGRLRLVRRTVDDHLVILHTACRLEFFAEASLFAATYHCDAVAAEPSRIRVYPKAKVMEALRTDPVLAPAFMARLAHQLQELRARMELRSIRSAPGAHPSIPATPRRPGPPQYRHRGPASGHCGGDRDNPRSAVSDPRPARSRRVYRARGISDCTQET